MWGKILGLGTLSIAASCAVLTVDVDVYKGPLANEPDVQAQQLTAIAVAARPVLIQLRDELEAQHRQIKPPGLPKDVLGKDYILDKEQLESTQARVVNGVLGLYRDKVDPAIAAFVGKGREIFEECKRLREQMERFEEDRKLWEQVRASNDPSMHKDLAPLLVPKNVGKPDASDRSILGPDRLFGVSGKSATTAFTKLAVVEDVEAELLKLIPSTKLRKQIARRIAQIAESYLDGRERLADGLELALSFHVAVAIHRDRLENARAITESSARLISVLIQPQQLALTPRTQGLGSPWLLPGDRQIFIELPTAPSGTDNWRPQDYQKAVRALRELLEAQPVEVAGALLRIHRLLREQASELSIHGRNSADFRFGLGRALTLDEGERTRIVEAFQTFRSMIALLGDVGLDGGRLDDGLLTMIHRYLAARDSEHVDGGANAHRSDAERKRLMDGLVHFAEKLRFLASHDEILRGGGASRGTVTTYVMALESIGNSILTLANEEQHRGAYERDDASQKTRETAIAALESVQAALTDLAKSTQPSGTAAAGVVTSTSVLDAEKNDGAAKTDETTAAAAKSNDNQSATTKTHDANAGDATAAPAEAVDAKSADTKTAASEADAAKDAAAEAERARAKFAKQLEAAEKLINTAASLAAYIRPPWAYLRNSTPISALQPGEGPIDNMLTDHAHRALLGNGNVSEFQRLASTLDRQFWQNINRVRVAGMGNTSYVLVKDDIGNWYVKGYSADPTPVLEGLQGAALAAQSGAMGMDLFARQDARAKARKENKAVEPVESTTMVGKQAKRFEKIYADEAKADSKGAREEHAKFVEEVSKAWEKHTGWEEGGDRPFTRKRRELTQELSNARAALAAAPVDGAKSPLFAVDVLAVLAKSLEFQEKAFALLDEAKLVSEELLIEKQKLLTNAASNLENARNEVELARAGLKAIEGVVGALPSELDKARSAVMERETKLATAAREHEAARNDRDAEATRIAAAKQLVSDLRADVRSIVGGAIRRRLEARRKSSESCSTALEVLSQSSESAQ